MASPRCLIRLCSRIGLSQCACCRSRAGRPAPPGQPARGHLAATIGNEDIRWRSLMAASYTAVIQQHGEWWIGWIEEVPGVNSQGQTRDELLDNLRDALDEALEMNRAEARAAAAGEYEEVSLTT